ncbi:mechanosensitive ion channel [soil metagenome]
MNETLTTWLYDPTVGKFITAAVALAIIFGIARIAKGSITRYVKQNDTRYRLRKFITFVSYVVIILILSIIFSDRLGGLTVALGVAGAGVAFALKEVIASFAGWFAVTFAGFYSPGDRIQLGGIKGDVIDISFLRTTLMEVGEWIKGDNYSGRIVRIANSFVLTEPVFNYSGEFPFLWDEIPVSVMHGSDHVRAREILLSAANEIAGEYSKRAAAGWKKFAKRYLLEDAITEPTVSLVATSNSIEFTVRYIVSYNKRRATKDLLFTRILDEFANTEGKVAFTTSTLQLIDMPTIDVRLSKIAE